MGSKEHPLNIFFFPIAWQGHLIPMLDMAKLFSQHGVQVSIITTPTDAPLIQSNINHTKVSVVHHSITLHLIEFPQEANVELPDANSMTDNDVAATFISTLSLLKEPFRSLLKTHRPDCIISDMFLPWTADVAAEFDVPRLSFTGSCFFSSCLGYYVARFSPHKNAMSDGEPFALPNLPHQIELTRSQMPDYVDGKGPFAKISEQMVEAVSRNYGVVMNSFYELEPDYVEYYKKEIENKAWHMGPFSLCDKETSEERAVRGQKASIEPSKCVEWLSLREPGSVIYVCFGSMCQFSGAQLMEIACALEACGRPFIWVVRGGDAPGEEWAPPGFRERTKDRGLIIGGWAPQATILGHWAVGGFVTHCGWNSVLEGVCAGVPMVTWPMFAEQFYNEKLVTRVLRVGVEVGALTWSFGRGGGDESVVGRERIERAVAQLMGDGDEARGMRMRVKELSDKAKRAWEEGGSSYVELKHFSEEIRMYAHSVK